MLLSSSSSSSSSQSSTRKNIWNIIFIIMTVSFWNNLLHQQHVHKCHQSLSATSHLHCKRMNTYIGIIGHVNAIHIIPTFQSTRSSVQQHVRQKVTQTSRATRQFHSNEANNNNNHGFRLYNGFQYLTHRRLYSSHSSSSNMDDYYSSSNKESSSPSLQASNNETFVTNIPLVFIPGLKGTHLSFVDETKQRIQKPSKLSSIQEAVRKKLEEQYQLYEKNKGASAAAAASTNGGSDDGGGYASTFWNEYKKLYGSSNDKSGGGDDGTNHNDEAMVKEKEQTSNDSKLYRKKRVWLTLSGLFNFPPKPDHYPDRSLALPLTYDQNGKQHPGRLVPDGIVDHVIELGPTLDSITMDGIKGGSSNSDNSGSGSTRSSSSRGKKNAALEFFPFYGHVTKHLNDMNTAYLQHVQDHHGTSEFVNSTIVSTPGSTDPSSSSSSKVPPFQNHIRPTAVFPYDWRRPAAELSKEFNDFLSTTFPNQPVQILAHSYGGLIFYNSMKSLNDTNKFIGATLVGVPFGTGIQYLQDMHKGYYTELGRCRQFTPKDQFTLSSHWSFFPTMDNVGNDLVDVSSAFVNNDANDAAAAATTSSDTTTNPALPPPPPDFQADVSSIGKAPGTQNLNREAIKGEKVQIDFYNVNDWEENEIGIFDPTIRKSIDEETMELYKNHMKIQLDNAKDWRQSVLECDLDQDDVPPLAICATDSIATVNQILRRERLSGVGNENKRSECRYEYDYVSGRSVPGDGRIDFDKAFPLDESNVPYKVVRLDSLHAKQMCWEDKGGSLGKIWCEVVDQMLHYENNKHDLIDKSFEETVETAMNEINQDNKKSLGNQYIKSKAKSAGKSKEGNERMNQESPQVSRGRSAAKPKLFIKRLQGWRQKRKAINSATASDVGGVADRKRKVFTERLKLRKVRRRFVRGIGRRNREIANGKDGN